ncbi:MAG: carboxypeptidase regulatory-like domain-containing protein [Terracidiphilus sp.]
MFSASATRILCRTALFLAASAIGAHAQSAPMPRTTSGYRISGTVINSASGEPVRRATVAVLSEEADGHIVESVETDNDGRFSLDGLPAAKFPLTASKRGFLTAFYDQHEGYNTAIVTGADQDTSGLVFRLTPGAALHGVVTADGGDPVEGAKVMLFLKPHGHNPGDRIKKVDEANSDDTGAYEFDGLAAGEYLLVVKAEPWYAMSRSAAGGTQRTEGDAAEVLDVAYPMTYFDSTTDEASASPIELTGGSREEANFNLHAVPALQLTVEKAIKQNGGTANPALRQIVFGADISFEHSRAPNPSGTGTAETDVVEFYGVAPGHYALIQGDPPRIADLELTTSQQISPDIGASNMAVTGSLRSADGSTLPENLKMNLITRDNAVLQMIGTTSSQGKFSFGMLPAGRYEIWIESSGKTLTVTSLTINGHIHPGNQLTVRDKPVQLVAMVSQSETRVEGFARKKDGKGQPGVMIVLVPREPSAFRSLVRRDQSDSDGSFSLRDVVSGQYTLVAIQDGWELDWARAEVIGRYLSHGVAVTVTESSGKLLKLSEAVPVQRP